MGYHNQSTSHVCHVPRDCHVTWNIVESLPNVKIVTFQSLSPLPFMGGCRVWLWTMNLWDNILNSSGRIFEFRFRFWYIWIWSWLVTQFLVDFDYVQTAISQQLYDVELSHWYQWIDQCKAYQDHSNGHVCHMTRDCYVARNWADLQSRTGLFYECILLSENTLRYSF